MQNLNFHTPVLINHRRFLKSSYVSPGVSNYNRWRHNIAVKVADRVWLELSLWFIPHNIRQAADLMPLKAAVQA